MNKELTSEQKLDEVLNFLYLQSEYTMGIDYITEKLSQYTNSELIKMLSKINKDGFCDKVNAPLKEPKVLNNEGLAMYNTQYYSITFDGRFFKEMGGYFNAKKNAQDENRIKKLKENLLIVGTWLAGIGSIALVVWEIYNKLHSSCH